MRQRRLKSCGYKFLRSIARMRLIREIFTWGISNMDDLLPVQKIRETRSLVCIYHPQPVYPLHILLVPKKGIRDLTELDLEENEFLKDLLMTVRSLIEEFNLEEKGYRLILNGGEYQDYPGLHFHLTSGDPS